MVNWHEEIIIFVVNCITAEESSTAVFIIKAYQKTMWLFDLQFKGANNNFNAEIKPILSDVSGCVVWIHPATI